MSSKVSRKGVGKEIQGRKETGIHDYQICKDAFGRNRFEKFNVSTHIA